MSTSPNLHPRRKKPTKKERLAATTKAHQRRVRRSIETREVIHEVGLKSYQVVRLTHLRYKDVPDSFIDIRVFSRGYDKAGREKFYPTRQGIHLRAEDFSRLAESWLVAAPDQQIKSNPR